MSAGGDDPENEVPDDGAEHTRRWVVRAVIAIALVTLVGLGVLWPRGDAPDLGTQPNQFVDATVTGARSTTCDAVEADALAGCQEVDVEITSGPDEGSDGVFVIRDTDFGVPRMEGGERVVLLDVETSPPPYRYAFADFQRAMPMWWLVALFVAAVVFVGRWQGVRALVGLAASGLILIAFIVPSLIRNESAVLVALVGTIAIAYVALYLAHGVNTATTVALAGTLASLVLIVGLAIVASELASLSGLANEDAQVLRVTADALDLRGLLVAGIVVGALGVLDDVTVTQVSTVAALRRANPKMDRVTLYREAITVGRDHVASTVNTLVLAYAGAALPLVLLFSQGSKPIGRILTSEIVAVEIVRMLVGSIGLILSVPITTALAAAVLSGREVLHAGHDHGHSLGQSHSRPSTPSTSSPRRRTVRRPAVEPPVDADTEPDTDTQVEGERSSGTERRPRWEDFGPDADPV
jgi:uncharacterized membrane protein